MVTYGSFLAFVFFLGIITENGALCKPDKKEVPMAGAYSGTRDSRGTNRQTRPISFTLQERSLGD